MEPNTQVSRRGVDVLKSILKADSVEEQFRNALGKSSPAFVASIISLYNGNTMLQQCDPSQVVKEALKAAVLNLPIDQNLGFAWVIPYNNSVKTTDGRYEKRMTPTFQIGSKGYVQLAMRTGQYRTINADVVYDGELQKVDKLTGEINFQGEKKSDKVIGYFAYIEMLNGFSKTLYVTKEQIEAHAKRFSKSYNSKSSPWTSDFDEMAIKTVVKRLLSKFGYLSIEMAGAMANDTESDSISDRDKAIESSTTQVIDIDDVQHEDIQEGPKEADPY